MAVNVYCTCVVSIRTERPSRSGVLFFEELSVCVAVVAIGDGFIVFWCRELSFST